MSGFADGPDDFRDTETYCLGLLTEEANELGQAIGKALRFGIDTPGPTGVGARVLMQREAGDVLAAIDFALVHRVLARGPVIGARNAKWAKLTNPESRDNLGRQLAPWPPEDHGFTAEFFWQQRDRDLTHKLDGLVIERDRLREEVTALRNELQRERDEAVANHERSLVVERWDRLLRIVDGVAP